MKGERHAVNHRFQSTRDIEAYLHELYGVDVGRDLISRVTDAVMDDVRPWQCVDGLKGFPEAIEAGFPQTTL